MAIDMVKTVPLKEKVTPKAPQEPEGLILEADYEEDRPVALLAERQRDFQKSLRGHYVDTEMPAA